MHARRILVVTYYYPPDTSIGGRRWHAMARYLREFGHEVTVLTTKAWGTDDADGHHVVRAPDLVTSARLRTLLGRPELPRQGWTPSVQKAPPSILADGVVPDAYLATWALRAGFVARRLVKERNIECLVTSGPPHSVHVLGLLLGKKRPAWIADFRDGWRFESLRDHWPIRVQESADGWMERRVASTASITVGVTRPIADDLESRLGANAALVPNGWDPGMAPGIRDVIPRLDPRFVNLVHTGTLSEAGRDPSVLFEALQDIHKSTLPDAARIRLVLAGRLSEADRVLLSKAPPNVVHIGHLTPTETIALQREATALLLLTMAGRRSEATGKLFEYLASGRPIVALAAQNEAARIVAETGTGISVAPDDRAGIFDLLIAVVDGRLTNAFAPVDLGRYLYPGPAIEFAAQIERAIGLAR